MKDNKYVVNRKNIYIGQVVRTSTIYRYQSKEQSLNNKGRLDTASWEVYRSVLFTINEDKLCNDLLYNSPNYPILNVTDDDVCLKLKGSNIVVKNFFPLEYLLEYFEFNETLTFEDIKEIREELFDSKFAIEHCELFGFKEIKPEDYKYYKDGKRITNPFELKRLILKENLLRIFGYREFIKLNYSILPKEYWKILRQMGDNSIMDVICGDEKRTNAFKPNKNESKIKKIRRF